MDSRWKRVLLLQTSFLGDTVLTLPLISEIKRRFPSSHLSVICSPLAAELLHDHPDIDEIIADDKKGSDKSLMALWRKGRLLKQNGYTLALTPHKSLRSALLLYFADIPYRVGFRESKGWFLFHARPHRRVGRHDIERTLSILEPFGIEPKDCLRNLSLPMTPESHGAMARLLDSLSIKADKLLIGINPGSVWPTKRWSASGFARLIELLKQKYDCAVLLFGGPDDVSIAGQIQDLCGHAAVNLAGKITLRQLPAALSACHVLVTNDSAPMHIAVARNVPTVAIFCATTPALGFYPYSADAIVVEKQLDCRPCGSHGGRRCPLGTEDCIRLIPVERVLCAVDELLERKIKTPDVVRTGCLPEFIAV
ncbi:MAG: lipopolysaccharide heptosyltransferase II [Alphaproteobacteria bacterium]